MKKFSLTLFLILATFVVFSQVPNTFNYQAVVRNSSGEIISNHSVSFRISILENSESGTVVYSETHTLTTNAFGLVNFKIGNGDNPTGTFSPTGWGVAPHFVKIEFDPAGGTAFTELATNKLASVPYAFTAENVVNDAVDDADADPANEIQQLSLNGTLLELSNGGGSVTLPTSGGGGGDNWGTQTVKTDATLTGNGTSTDPLKVVGDLSDDQTLSVSGHELSISGGNTVNLSGSNFWTQTGNILSYPSGTVQMGSIPITDEGVLLDVRTTDKDIAFYAENKNTNSTIQIRNLGTGGAAWFHNKIKISDGTQGAGKVLTSDADGNSSWQTPATSSSLWTESESDIYRSSGNVGIGTESPTAKLDIESSSNAIIKLYSFNGNRRSWISRYDDRLHIASSDKIYFGTNGATDADVVIDHDGNVGIGTTNPKNKLHIKDGGIQIDYGSIKSRLDLITESGDNTALHTNGNDLLLTNWSEGTIAFSTLSSVATASERLTIAAHTGLVSIKNDLEVNGRVSINGGTPGNGKVLTSDADGNASWQTPATSSSLWTESGSNIYRSSGNVGIGTTTPSAPLEIKSNNEPLLIIGSASSNNPTRPGIKFINNTSQYIAADDGSDEIFGFYSKWGDTRTHDAKLRVYGKASGSWGKYMEFTHDGTNGKIRTDAGDITISPASNKVKIDGRITSSTSGNDADLKAYAYGTINADGTKYSGTNNFTIDADAGIGIYKITFDSGYGYNVFTTVVTVHSLGPRFVCAYAWKGVFVIKIYLPDGVTLTNSEFSFVTYKK